MDKSRPKPEGFVFEQQTFKALSSTRRSHMRKNDSRSGSTTTWYASVSW